MLAIRNCMSVILMTGSSYLLPRVKSSCMSFGSSGMNCWRQHWRNTCKSKDAPHNCAQIIHIIPADPNFEKKRNSSALFAREINLVTQPSFDCEQGINSQVQTACSNADAIFPVLGIVSCRNERFSLSRKTHVPLWNEPRISHVRLL